MNKNMSLEELNVIDAFSLFRVNENATNEEIKKAYRKLATLYHPDINQDDIDANEKIQIINLSYEKVKNEEARTNYKRTKYNQEKRAYEDFLRNQHVSTDQGNTPEEEEHATHQENQGILFDETAQEDKDFEEFLAAKGDTYKGIYEMYFDQLMSLEVDSTDQCMDQKRMKQTIRKLAIEYTDNYVEQVSSNEANRRR